VLAGIGAALSDLVWGMAALLRGSALSDVFVGREIYFKALCWVMLLGPAGWSDWQQLMGHGQGYA
jgi:hypothetical protein